MKTGMDPSLPLERAKVAKVASLYYTVATPAVLQRCYGEGRNLCVSLWDVFLGATLEIASI